MCEGCGCHSQWVKAKRPSGSRPVAPGVWHVHADGTAHRHAHGHDAGLPATAAGAANDQSPPTAGAKPEAG